VDEHKFNVKLSKIIDEFSLETVYAAENIKKVIVSSNEVNRPSLQIAGFFDYFDNSRIQVIGKVEISYLEKMTREERLSSLEKLFEKDFPALVVTREIDVLDEMLEVAKKYNISILRTSVSTSRFISALIAFLNIELAPRMTTHGVLVEVYGEGVLLLGDSGVGKSETAIELVKRGHRLVADDAVEIRKISNYLVGSAPELIRHYIELRGIGVINVRQLFGMRAIIKETEIDMVVQLESWDEQKFYDRLGLEDHYLTIMEVKVPCITIPVRPGRNLASIVEVAAMNNRHRRYGYNDAQELVRRIDQHVDGFM